MSHDGNSITEPAIGRDTRLLVLDTAYVHTWGGVPEKGGLAFDKMEHEVNTVFIMQM